MDRTEQIKRAVLKAGVWQFGDYVFASGKPANNKFEMPLALKDEAAKKLVLKALGELALEYEPEALWGVPSGGQEFAHEIGTQLGLPVVYLQKRETQGFKAVDYLLPRDRALAIRTNRLVGIEDVINEGTSITRTLRLPELSQNTVAIVACWIRGIMRVHDSLPIEGVIKEPVPNIIDPRHPFYHTYGRYAVEEESAPA